MRENRSPPGAPLPGDDDARPLLDPDDRSVQVHACHGRARQVEVLRDAILHLLEEDDTLEPRDVIVMCPDIETFAPLIQATFGAGEVAATTRTSSTRCRPTCAPPDLRVRLADRSLRQTNPVLGVVARLIELADERRRPPRRCSTSPTASRCAAASASTTTTSRASRTGSPTSGIRWGLDAEHRAPFKLDALAREHVAARASTACSSA